MVRSAKKLAAEFRSEGWKPGMDVRRTQTFLNICEATGCDEKGRVIEGEKSIMHLGDDHDGFRIRDLFESLVIDRFGDPVGASFVHEYFDPQSQGLLEASGAMAAVDSTAFANVTGQLLVTRILEPYQNEQYVVKRLIPTYPSPLRQERWIATSPAPDPNTDDLIVSEMQPLDYGKMGEQYVETMRTRKRQRGMALTKEALFFNLTGDLVRNASAVGDQLAYSIERECMGVVMGGITDATLFTEKRQNDDGPVVLDLYQGGGITLGGYTPAQAATNYPNSEITDGVYGKYTHQLGDNYSTRPYGFVNDVPNNPLDDYHAVEYCDQYFSAIVDPNRGRPIVIGKPYILAPYQKRVNISRVLKAENVYKLTQQGVNTVGALLTNSPNPLGDVGMSADQIAVSRLLQAEMVLQLSISAAQARDIWFYGDIGGAIKYVENWPLTVVQAPANSEAEFSQDIVMRWKASTMGRCVIEEPRKILRCNFINYSSGV